ncbi:MAG TPA: hypothetical protein VJT78_01695 [Candidatus Dormibacteraeota bacterium]|nr:hypothetical protein [Candidatus Dormibacteraeota bacterium]
MVGLMISILVIFAILLLVTRAAGVLRGRRLGVAGVETSREGDIQPALTGAAMGAVALLLVAFLYIGITQWDWLGRPGSQGGAPVVTAAPVQSPASGLGAAATASPTK